MAMGKDAYGNAKDGFRGYAREVARKGTNSLTGNKDPRYTKAFAMGYGYSSNQAVKEIQNSANKQMQSNLQRKAAARRNALTSKAAGGAQAMGTAMRSSTGSARPAAQVARPAARPAAQAGAARGAQAMAAAMRRR